MRHEKTNTPSQASVSTPPFSYRPASHLVARFQAVLAVSKRTKASVLHEGLEKVLPELETKHAADLARLKRSKTKPC